MGIETIEESSKKMAEEKQAGQIVRHEHVSIRPESELKVTLSRGQKGNYGWEIQYAGEDKTEVLEIIGETDRELRERYANENIPPNTAL